MEDMQREHGVACDFPYKWKPLERVMPFLSQGTLQLHKAIDFTYFRKLEVLVGESLETKASYCVKIQTLMYLFLHSHHDLMYPFQKTCNNLDTP
jgi:hypothetical protein